MLYAAVSAQIEIPPVIFLFESELLHACGQKVESLLSLRTADDLAYTGNEHIDRGYRLSVVIETHIERLDLLRVIGDEDRLFEYLFGKESFVFGLKVCAPIYGVLELVFMLFKYLYRTSIGDLFEIAVYDMVKPFDKTLIHKVVEELHFFRALFEDVFNNVLDHVSSEIHIVVKIGESNFRLNHPELSGVAVGIALLRSESGSESINVAERERETLCVELTAYGKVGAFTEEVLRKIYAAVLFERRILGIESGHSEHFARAFAVAARDKRSVHVYKVS